MHTEAASLSENWPAAHASQLDDEARAKCPAWHGVHFHLTPTPTVAARHAVHFLHRRLPLGSWSHRLRPLRWCQPFTQPQTPKLTYGETRRKTQRETKGQTSPETLCLSDSLTLCITSTVRLLLLLLPLLLLLLLLQWTIAGHGHAMG